MSDPGGCLLRGRVSAPVGGLLRRGGGGCLIPGGSAAGGSSLLFYLIFFKICFLKFFWGSLIETPRQMATAAAGTHHTGMHYCFILKCTVY